VTRYRIVSWRDIPVQVKVRDTTAGGSTRLSRPLSSRFQKTVHRAAYRAKAISGSEYIQEWRMSEWREQEGSAEAVITAVIAELEAAYDEERLDRLARNKGFEPFED
jgi:hypothetical protein